MYPCTKLQSFWRTSDLGTNFPKKALLGGVVGQTQPENNLF